MRFIGVDLHTTQITVCCLSETEKPQIKTYSLAKMAEFIKELRPSDSVAVEATGNTNWFVSQIENRVERVVIVEPRSFEVIRRSVKKTDERDAEALANFLRAGLLPEARRRTPEQEAVRSLAQTREKLIGLRTKLINQTHALLVRHGRKEKRERLTGSKGLAQVIEKYEWSQAEQVELEVIRQQVEALGEGIGKLDKRDFSSRRAVARLRESGVNQRHRRKISSRLVIGHRRGCRFQVGRTPCQLLRNRAAC